MSVHWEPCVLTMRPVVIRRGVSLAPVSLDTLVMALVMGQAAQPAQQVRNSLWRVKRRVLYVRSVSHSRTSPRRSAFRVRRGPTQTTRRARLRVLLALRGNTRKTPGPPIVVPVQRVVLPTR